MEKCILLFLSQGYPPGSLLYLLVPMLESDNFRLSNKDNCVTPYTDFLWQLLETSTYIQHFLIVVASRGVRYTTPSISTGLWGEILIFATKINGCRGFRTTVIPLRLPTAIRHRGGCPTLYFGGLDAPDISIFIIAQATEANRDGVQLVHWRPRLCTTWLGATLSVFLVAHTIGNIWSISGMPGHNETA